MATIRCSSMRKARTMLERREEDRERNVGIWQLPKANRLGTSWTSVSTRNGFQSFGQTHTLLGTSRFDLNNSSQCPQAIPARERTVNIRLAIQLWCRRISGQCLVFSCIDRWVYHLEFWHWKQREEIERCRRKMAGERTLSPDWIWCCTINDDGMLIVESCFLW